MTKTEYLALNKPSDSDYVDINPLNANCDVIDSFAKSAETDIDNLNNAVADIAKDVSDISGVIEDKADKAAVDSLSEDVGTLEEELENKADKSELEDKADKSELENKADKSELAALSEAVSGKADASEITRIDGAIADKADKSELGSYAKKTDLNAYATSDQLQAASTTLDTKIEAVNNRIQELSISDWAALTTVDPNTLYVIDDGGVSTASTPTMAAYSPADFEDGGVATIAYVDTPLDEDMPTIEDIPTIEGEPTEDGE